ncbi:XRE family transcriptional regulator [Streptomyces sp. NPDC001404]|uniref:XRE family transcriptional regulator n=1 Tax=Streptomyces sp. NPDC001404 TaxID=3364571 RepID=UPI0036C9AAE3
MSAVNTERRRNEQLIAWMTEQDWSAAGLAKALNAEIAVFTGRVGRITEGTIRKWRSGEIRWPRTVQRVALTRVSGRPSHDLGFVHPSTPPEEDDVQRRAFLNASAGTLASAAIPALRPRPAVGTSDVLRLKQRVAHLTVLDEQRGGQEPIEQASLTAAADALKLQEKSATDPVRRRLYVVAADCVGLAAWCRIDACDPETAQRHLERAMTLAGLGRDSVAQFRIWHFMSMLSAQRGDLNQALAAAQASRGTGAARRDHLLASLAHARTALAHAQLGDHQAARRSAGYAETALAKARTDIPRPDWVAFYNKGELDGLTGAILSKAGHHQEAEAHLHQCLASLRPEQHRNRALYSAYIALEQIAQGDAEAAVHTALQADAMPAAATGRTSQLLTTFTTTLTTAAPGSDAARDWADRPRATTAWKDSA